MEQTSLLEVKNLTAQLAGKPVLKDVSFEILNHGECLASSWTVGKWQSQL